MTIRFAVWAAVSTQAQATAGEKVSLEVQVTKCRDAAGARNWREAAGPYVVKGESRQRWVNLRDAEMEIPELHQMLEEAQAGKYDVLVMYDYNRLRDLLDMVSKSLSHYKVQIFSVSQPIEPTLPETYSPYTSDTAVIMEVMSKFTSRLQNNDLRRKYMEAMPRRVSQRGLPAGGNVPFGYKRGANSKTPPTIDPETSPLVIQAKDMLLEGKSTIQIAEWLATSGKFPKSGKWYPQTVKSILTNPFYAGILRWGVTRSELDPRSGQTKKNRAIPKDKYVMGKGLHEPLWDNYTYQAILSEFRNRGHSYKGRSTQRLTGLLSCGVCQERLWTFYNNHVSAETMVWRCSSREEHVSILDSQAVQKVQQAIINHVMQDAPRAVAAIPEKETTRGELVGLKEQRKRIGDAYASGAFSMDEFMQRTGPLDDQIAELDHKLAEADMIARDEEAREKAIYWLKENIAHVPAFLEKTNAQEANHFLKSVLREIVVGPTGEIELIWK